MNPDCPYCGLKDGLNIEHTCDPKAMKRMLDNLYREIRKLKDESKPKRPVTVERIYEILHWIIGTDGSGQMSAAKAIFAEINEGEK